MNGHGDGVWGVWNTQASGNPEPESWEVLCITDEPKHNIVASKNDGQMGRDDLDDPKSATSCISDSHMANNSLDKCKYTHLDAFESYRQDIVVNMVRGFVNGRDEQVGKVVQPCHAWKPTTRTEVI